MVTADWHQQDCSLQLKSRVECHLLYNSTLDPILKINQTTFVTFSIMILDKITIFSNFSVYTVPPTSEIHILAVSSLMPCTCCFLQKSAPPRAPIPLLSKSWGPQTNTSSCLLTWAIPVTEIGTPWRVYTRGDSTFKVIVLRDILQTNQAQQGVYVATTLRHSIVSTWSVWTIVKFSSMFLFSQ